MEVVFASAITGLAENFVANGYLPLAPFLIPRHLVGRLLSLQGFISCATLVVVGPIVDRVGSGRVLHYAIGIQMVCIVVTVLSTSLPGQVFGRILQGVAGSAIFNPCIAFVMDHFLEPERANHIGTVLGACMVGGLLGAPAISGVYALAGASSYRLILAFLPGAALMMLGWAALSRALRRPLPVRETLLEKPTVVAAESCQCLRSIFGVYVGVGPQAWLLAAMLSCVCCSMGALECAGVLLMHGEGLSPAAIGTAFIPPTLAQAIISPYAGHLSSTPQRRRLVLVGSLLFLAIGLCTVALLPQQLGSEYLAIAAMVTSSVAMALVDAPSISLMGSLAAAKGFGPGEAVTASEMAVTGGWALGPIVGQLALQHAGFQGLCLGFAAMGGILGAWCAATLRAEDDATCQASETTCA